MIETLVVGQLATNCYLFYDEGTRLCLIIDPGDDADYIINKIRDLELKPKAILATHGHFDHLLAVSELKLAFKIPFYFPLKDLPILKKMSATAKYFLGREIDFMVKPDWFLKQGQKLKLGKSVLEVWETPGHTPGSLSYLASDRVSDRVIFSGDLIFSDGSFGRTDLQGGNEQLLAKSIKKILLLEPNTMIYPGHGQPTTVGKERKYWTNLLK